jgi:hypothetical protein
MIKLALNSRDRLEVHLVEKMTPMIPFREFSFVLRRLGLDLYKFYNPSALKGAS